MPVEHQWPPSAADMMTPAEREDFLKNLDSLPEYTRAEGESPYWDRKGRNIGLREFVKLTELGDPEYGPSRWDYACVRLTEIGGLRVSSIWLGMSIVHKVPVVFETMVFDADGSPLNDFQERHVSEQAAIEGHNEIVVTLAATLEGDPTPVQLHPQVGE